jgi:hypothetical protein
VEVNVRDSTFRALAREAQRLASELAGVCKKLAEQAAESKPPAQRKQRVRWSDQLRERRNRRE